MKCDYCEMIERQDPMILAELDGIVIAVKDFVASPGQITIFPKEHFTILEIVPDVVLEQCAKIANKVSIVLFESFGSHGTNIFVQNGLSAAQKVPHFALEIIPRVENDNLPLQWQPKQLSEDEMDTAFLMLKQEGDKLIDIGSKKEKKGVVPDGKEGPEKVLEKEGGKNYLLRSIRRLP